MTLNCAVAPGKTDLLCGWLAIAGGPGSAVKTAWQNAHLEAVLVVAVTVKVTLPAGRPATEPMITPELPSVRSVPVDTTPVAVVTLMLESPVDEDIEAFTAAQAPAGTLFTVSLTVVTLELVPVLPGKGLAAVSTPTRVYAAIQVSVGEPVIVPVMLCAAPSVVGLKR